MVETKTKLQRYGKYVDSGVEWLGEIPKHWKMKKIKFLSDIFNGDSLNELLKKRYESDDLKDLAYISSKDINVNNSEIAYENGLRIPKEDFSLKIAPSNSSLLCIEGGSAGRKIAFTNQEVCFVNKLACFKIKGNNYSKYLFFSLKGSPFQTQFKLSMTGMIGGVSISSINNFCLPLPPLSEQTKIAQFLDDKTSKIDVAVTIKEQQINLLKERKQILIHKAVTQGLNPNVTLEDSGVEWIGEIPEGWEVKKLKYATRIFRGKFTHRPRNDERMYDGDYPFFQTGDVARAGKYLSGFIQTLNEKGLRVSTLFPKGTIVITIAANIGDISILDIDACFPDSIVGFEPNDFIEKHFLYNTLLVMKEQFMSSTIKNTQMNLNVDRIGSNSIVVPSFSEQKKISVYIESASQKIDTAIILKQQEIEKLKEYKSSLINSVVTGKVRVC